MGEETITPVQEKYSINLETLQSFGTKCRTLTNESEELFTINEMENVLNWAQNEALTQKNLIDQIQIAINQKVNDEVITDE